MTMGPGKYDDLATYVRDTAKARGVLVIVLDGEKGSGFSCQTDVQTLIGLPAMLRDVADNIEKGLTEEKRMPSKKKVIEKIRAMLTTRNGWVTLSREEAETLVNDEDLRNELLAQHADKWT
jgi:enoyl-CoA hydratase/carnithine racemase